LRRNNEVSRLAYSPNWSLVEEQRNEDTAKRNSGVWRPTDRGRDFVNRNLFVPAWVTTYNKDVDSWSPDLVGIDAALNHKFDYSKLMSGTIEPL
jgi:hypothetical protein